VGDGDRCLVRSPSSGDARVLRREVAALGSRRCPSGLDERATTGRLPLEHSAYGRAHRYGPRGPLRLGVASHEDRAEAVGRRRALERARDRQPAGLEVNIAPPEREQLALTKSGSQKLEGISVPRTTGVRSGSEPASVGAAEARPLAFTSLLCGSSSGPGPLPPRRGQTRSGARRSTLLRSSRPARRTRRAPRCGCARSRRR